MSVSALCKYFLDLIISVVLSVDNNCNSLYTLGLYIYGFYIKIITFINKVILYILIFNDKKYIIFAL